VLRWLRAHGLPIAKTPGRHLPEGACYLNVSQFPLWVPSYFRWLEGRPDVKAVFFIHDLLPLDMPEYFPAGEAPRHLKRLQNLARFGAGAIVTTETVRAALSAHLASIGRTMPILVAPTPMSPVFTGPAEPDARLADTPYFVCCSTIEPRKNHLMLLHVWRELVARDGKNAPRLVLVGKRGWQFGPVVDMLAHAPAMRSHVVEVRGLTTPGLRRLLDGARALLMPTFGEGYGLPVHEALAAGVPVIASAIPVFAEIDDPALTLLSPIDGEGWLAAIRAAAHGPRPHGSNMQAHPRDWDAYFAAIETFLTTL
jgi:glycosyltransferase involved in cell wall biosynthesis